MCWSCQPRRVSVQAGHKLPANEHHVHNRVRSQLPIPAASCTMLCKHGKHCMRCLISTRLSNRICRWQRLSVLPEQRQILHHLEEEQKEINEDTQLGASGRTCRGSKAGTTHTETGPRCWHSSIGSCMELLVRQTPRGPAWLLLTTWHATSGWPTQGPALGQ